MTDQVDQDAHAVFLPAFGDLELSDSVRAFLKNGGVALLPGESRDEYVAREMSTDRITSEKRDHFRSLADGAMTLTGRPILVAVDQELGGIRRLHQLVPQLPGAADAAKMTGQEIERISYEVAVAAKQFGINMFLSPIVDVVTGKNDWLRGRTISTDPETVSRVASSFVRGIQRAGVVATAKHFPGHHDISADPAVSEAVVSGNLEELAKGFGPFREVIAAGTLAVMTGPAIVPSLDVDEPASLSPKIINLLRTKFGFTGMVVSDDLDSKATMRSDTLERAAIAALNAGSDLLLVAAGAHLGDLIASVAQATRDGHIPSNRLSEAATRVRQTARWAA